MVKRKHRPLHPLVKALIGLVILAILGFFAYSLQQYYGHNTESGVMICDTNGQDCQLSVHVHANVDATVCGEKLRLPLETGGVDGPHTHKERNRIHLETVLPFDPAAQRITDTTKMQLGTFFDVMGVRLTETCIADRCNGDPCNGKPGMLALTIDGQQVQEIRAHVWTDEETMTLTFQ